MPSYANWGRLLPVTLVLAGCSSLQPTYVPTPVYVAVPTQGRPVQTYVSGTFEGCSYGRILALENGMRFRCSTYRYHYAYRPKVLILGNTAIIDGDEYEGYVSY